MRSFATTGIYLDKSYLNRDNKHPIKIRVTYQRKSKFFKTQYSVSEKDFESSYKALRPRGTNYHFKESLLALESKSKKIIDSLEEFTFEKWESLFYQTQFNKDDVTYHFYQKIEELLNDDRISSKELYSYTLSSLMTFLKIRKDSGFSFTRLTPKKLRDFEKWLENRGRSTSTTGMYMRCLRHIFNRAIQNNDIPSSLYPFGASANKYSIPQGRNIKKGLSIENIKKIKGYNLQDYPHMEKARDFWMISFYSNGINLNDLLRLKHADLVDNRITFVRRKTSNTRKTVEPTELFLIEDALKLIEKYKGDGEFLFPIIDGLHEEEKVRKAIKAFNRFVNQHMYSLSKMLNLDARCSAIYARHTWATLAINNGVSIEHISLGLSHESINTTKSYIKGLSLESKKKLAQTVFKDL